jgi:transcriptional regulator with XRE-family HTH domain
MEKTKLSEMRKFKGFTQEQIAKHLCMDGSTYSRRESGEVKLNIVEWEKLAKVLNVPLSEIYEQDESQVLICNDNATGNFITNHGTNNIHPIQESLLATQEKYIKKLEEEVAVLKLQMGK